MEESEKQKLRQLKKDTSDILRGIDVGRYHLSRIDGRLEGYVSRCIAFPEEHNLYELLSVKRFFTLLDRYVFRPTAVAKFIGFYESLPFTGVKGRTKYRLTPVQVFQFASMLGFYRSDGKRLCREALLFVPRKYSKTTSVATLAIYDLLFGDANAQAYVAANSYQQALICFNEIRSILRNMDRRLSRFKINREIIYSRMAGRTSFARCLAANPDKLDGLNASMVILDEYSQADNAELKNVLTSSMGARVNPMTVVITTASDKIDAPFYEMLQSYKSILRGEAEDDTVFGHIFEPDIDDDEGDYRTWRKVQPHLGVTVQTDFYEYEYMKAQRSRDDMLAFRNKLLNIFAVNEEKAWIPAELIRGLFTDTDVDALAGRPPTMCAIDLSIHDDFSVVTYNVYDEKQRSFFIHNDYYLPREALEAHENHELYERWIRDGYMNVCEGSVINYRQIVGDILRRNRNLCILQIGYDSYKSQECVNMLSAAGASNVLKAVSQTYGNFTSAVESFEYAARTGKIHFSRNPINAYCFGNAVMDTDRLENKKPIKLSKNRKIDSVITSLMTFRLFNDYER